MLMESYEQWDRIERELAGAAALMFPHAQLSEGDYLVAEGNRLMRRLADINQRVKRARRVFGQVGLWLSILVIYQIVMVALLRLL